MDEQVVLVTGAGSGMGEAVALLAAARGAKVVVADINEKAAQSVVETITAQGGQAISVKCNVTNAKEVKTMIDQTVTVYGRLDAAFNNAGIMVPMTDTADLDEEVFDRVVDINLKGVWLCMKYELQQMRKQGNGAIVNNSSIGGLVGSAGRSAYHAAKHGVLGLTKCAAVEYAPKGIRINAVCPGTIETPMVDSMFNTGDLSERATTEGAPIKRLGKATEVAEAVLWLFSPASSYVIGQPISVDGGLSII
ncbi:MULTISPECIES: glucose 1-dehydrogenase [unclassified Spirosoma]|uniref:SDR family NAD(P)-dependent oxidoreductase n=1 Tax=unclassified Spirosoma TaxID=2621999 RepID=UPI000969BF1A|nr:MULTISPECIES: glucose 1-dehydrogenase [unclassified Spirosoma]MBN8826635.1 SDR family oxidoreductase [Spirosoma sp.]OJW74472.1 MAG: oxidoreductase [Spirosoma sp. 48-14]